MAILVLSLLVIAFFIRKRRAASRKKQITVISHPLAPIDDANKPSTITVQEIDDGWFGCKEMADTGIVELPHEHSVSELTGSLPNLIPNLSHLSTRPRQLARNPATNSFKKRRLAICTSTGSTIMNWMKQIKNTPSDNKNGCDDVKTSPVPDLNRALPPIPHSERVRFSWKKRNKVIARPSACQGIASTPCPDSHRALPQTPQSESVRFSWIMRNMVLDRQSSSQVKAWSNVDSVGRYGGDNPV